MEWLPGNKEYDLAGKYNIEWYSADGDPDSTDYESAIWIPVIPKKKILSRHKKTALPMRKTAGRLLFYVGSRVKPCQNFVNRHAAFRKRYGGRLTHAHTVPIAERRKCERAVFIRHRKTRAA